MSVKRRIDSLEANVADHEQAIGRLEVALRAAQPSAEPGLEVTTNQLRDEIERLIADASGSVGQVAGQIMHALGAYPSTDRSRLLGLLRRVEWVQPMSNSNPECPICTGRHHIGHAQGCALAAALTPDRPTPGPVGET